MFKFANPIILTVFALTNLLPAYAEEVDLTGYAVINIEQISPQEGVLGDWTLIKPGNKQVTMTKKSSHTLDGLFDGNYTLIVDPPAGASTVIDIHRSSGDPEAIDRRQISFPVADGEQIDVKIQYSFTKVGTVSVNSQPNGMQFTLKGPNDMELHGKTPDSFQQVPEGQYSVTFAPIDGCVTPRPQSQRLEKDSRVAFTITISCDGLEDIPQAEEEGKTLDYVNYTHNGETVILNDIAVSDWYAPYVHKVAKAKILTGYTGSNGQPTGVFGPGDNVNIAQLAKIAHEVAGLDEERRDIPGTPANTRARGTWAEAYFASAEHRDWIIFRDTRLDPGRPATRGEVVVTLLQALDVPRDWAKGTLFTDVSTRTKFADSIETAAADGVIAGYTTGGFGPENPINRAEMAKVISQAIDQYIENTAEFTGESLD